MVLGVPWIGSGVGGDVGDGVGGCVGEGGGRIDVVAAVGDVVGADAGADLIAVVSAAVDDTRMVFRVSWYRVGGVTASSEIASAMLATSPGFVGNGVRDSWGINVGVCRWTLDCWRRCRH